MKALRLTIRPARAARFRPFVPVEPEPPELPLDGSFRLLRRTLGVGVLDAQDERPARPAREEPVEQRRPRVADVQVAGWTGGETNPLKLLTNAIAWTAMASPRPISPRPSFVFPLMLTRSSDTPRTAARLARIWSMYGASLGRSRMTVASTLPTARPSARTTSTARLSRSTLEAPFHRGSVSEKWRPMSPAPAAPRIASVTAWHTASASECPARPRSKGIVTPPRINGRPSTKRWRS